jgi:hypothetical protein
VNNEWVETAEGYWAGFSPQRINERLWSRFVHIVKHEVHYFFQHSLSISADQGEYDPIHLLSTIGGLVNKLDLLRSLPGGASLFRAREKEEGKD